MSSNQDFPDVASASPVSFPEDRRLASLLESVGPIAREAIVSLLTFCEAAGPANDSAVPGGIPDTTPLVAHPKVVRSIRAALRRCRVAPHDMDDAIAEVQCESIEAARTRGTPRSLAQWTALANTIAVHRALDRLREAKARSKYDVALRDDADVFVRTTLREGHADPIDTKTYLAVLKDLFDSGQMPEHGEEILQGVADEVPQEEIAAEIGVTTTVVRNRLYRMRSTFRARLAALGMLSLVLLLLGVLLWPIGKPDVAAPRTTPTHPTPPVGSVSGMDGGASPDTSGNRPRPSDEIAPFPLK
jgi:DNA-directed RNA polymerase specialized sigma24 family protein